ncbi:MAG: RluA family pseudouridine synthase [Patescibacteria group bacterium]
MEPNIIYEDESLLVLDKPSGWIVNEAETTTDQPVVQNWLKENFQFSIFNFQELRNGIVHRLDKETSGILIVAKTKEAFVSLQEQFKSRKVEKAYTALVHGKVEPKGGEVEVPVGRLPWRKDRFGVLPGGRASKTSYGAVGYYQKENETFSLVEARPKTGRTHQIRIHFKYLGHPVVSDEFYAGRKTARKDRTWCPRLFLHASQIKFIHPVSHKSMEFHSELPGNLKEILYKLSPLL